MKFSTKSFLLLATSAALMFCGERASAQSNTSQAVQHVQSGNKVFLEINAIQLESELNELFQTVSSPDSEGPNLSWSDVLGNGSNPGMDINFSSYDITGLGGLTSTGTLAADSLTLAKDAAITGRLSVLDAVSFGDSLTVSGLVEFSDSLEVVKAVTIGETLYVTGLTSLGDSVHVAGNVDLEALFNVDGAATFGSTMTVSGETTLNDSLYVNSGANITGTLEVDGETSLNDSLHVNSGANITGTLEVDGETTLNDSLHANSGANITGTLYADSIDANMLQINRLAVDSVVNNSTEGVVFAPHGVGEDDLEGGLEVGIPLSKSNSEGVANYLWTGNDRRTNYRDLSVFEQYYAPTETWNWMESYLADEDGWENGYSWSYFNLFSARDEDSSNYRGNGEIYVDSWNPDVSYAFNNLWMDSDAEGTAHSYLENYSEDMPYSGYGYSELDSRSTPTSSSAEMYTDAEVDLTNTWSEAFVEVDSDEDGSAFDFFVTAYSTPDYDAYSESGLDVNSFPDSVRYTYSQKVNDADNNQSANVELDIISDVTGEQSFAIDMLDYGSGYSKSAEFSMERSDWEDPYDATLRTDSGNIALTNAHAGWQMTNNMSANYPEFAEVPAEELAFLLGNNTGIHSQSVSRATHVGALDTRTAAIQSDVALGRVQASATLLDWTATSDVAGDFVTESGQISPAAGLGFPAEALESTFFLQNIQQIPSGFLGAGRYASNPEVTNPELAGQGIDQAIWAQDTLLLQSGYNSDDDEMTSTLMMVEEGIAVSGNSFYVTGETTLNDSLHVMDSAEFAEDVNIAENLYVDTIKSTSGDEILMLVPGSNFSSQRVVQDDSVLDEIQSADGTTTVDMELDNEGFELRSKTKDENYHTSEAEVYGYQQRSDRTWNEGSTTGSYEHQYALATMRTETDTEVPGGRDVETENVIDANSQSDRNNILLRSEMVDKRDGYDKSEVRVQLSNIIDGDVSRTSFQVDADDDFHGEATIRLRAQDDVLQSFVENDLGLLLVDGNDVLYRDDPDQVKQGSVGGNNIFELEVTNRRVELGGLDIEAAKLQGSIADFDLDFNTEARIELVGGPSWIDDTFDPDDDMSNVGGDYRTGTQHPGGAVQTLAWERAKLLTGQHWDIMNETGAGTFSMNTPNDPANFVGAVWADTLRVRGGSGYNSSTLQLSNNKTELYSDTLFVSGVIENEMIANLQAQIELLESALASISDFEAPQAPTLSVPNITALAYNEGTVVFEITDDGGAAISEVGYEFSTSADMQPAEVVAFTNPSGTTITAELSDLEELSTYYFRAYAKNLKGTTYAEVVTIETPVTPCGLPYSYNGYDYATVSIGSQCWFAENVQTTQNNQGVDYYTNRYSNPDGDASNVADYGLLYKHDVVMNADICPTGWSVPSPDGWNALFNAVGGASVAGQALKAASLDGNDTYGFTALGAGRKTTTFQNFGFVGWFRSDVPTTVFHFGRYDDNVQTITNGNWNHMYSIRCLRDE